jgi:hypothetical protein
MVFEPVFCLVLIRTHLTACSLLRPRQRTYQLSVMKPRSRAMAGDAFGEIFAEGTTAISTFGKVVRPSAANLNSLADVLRQAQPHSRQRSCDAGDLFSAAGPGASSKASCGVTRTTRSTRCSLVLMVVSNATREDQWMRTSFRASAECPERSTGHNPSRERGKEAARRCPDRAPRSILPLRVVSLTLRARSSAG